LGLLAGEQVELPGDLVGAGQGGVVDAAGEFGRVRGLDQLGVVDAAGFRWCGRRRVNVSRSFTEVGKLQFRAPKTGERRSVPFPASLTEELAALMVG